MLVKAFLFSVSLHFHIAKVLLGFLDKWPPSPTVERKRTLGGFHVREIRSGLRPRRDWEKGEKAKQESVP